MKKYLVLVIFFLLVLLVTVKLSMQKNILISKLISPVLI